MPVTINCKRCLNDFRVARARAKSARYCSRACRTKAGQVQGACLSCGVRTIVSVSKAKNGRGRFCSRDCQQAHKRGGLPYLNDDGTKTCSSCGRAQPFDAFELRADSGRFRSECKACRAVYLATYCSVNGDAIQAKRAAYRAENKEEINRRQSQRYSQNREAIQEERRRARASDPEKFRAAKRDHYWRNADRMRAAGRRSYAKHRHKRKAYFQRWYAKNRKSRITSVKLYRQANAEKIRERRRQWCRNRPLAARAQIQRRRARLARAEGRHSRADLIRLWHRQRGECARCGVRFGKRPSDNGFHVDHVTPLSRGGSNWPRNLQLLCPSCNCSKGAKTPAEFTLYLRRVDGA